MAAQPIPNTYKVKVQMKRYKQIKSARGLTTLGPAMILVAGLLVANDFNWIAFIILILLGAALRTLATLTLTFNERQRSDSDPLEPQSHIRHIHRKP